MDITELIEKIRLTPDCEVFPPAGLPVIRAEHTLPEDLREFYELCGGVDLFKDTAYCLTIVPPSKLVVANPVIIIGVDDETVRKICRAESWSWSVIGEGENAQYITIDLSQEHLGRCYDSMWDRHPHSSVIIANSFTELLSNLLLYQENGWYWKQEDSEFFHKYVFD